MAIEMVFGHGVNGDAASLGKGIGNYFEALAIHFYVFGSGEAEVLDAGTLVGTGVGRPAAPPVFSGTVCDMAIPGCAVRTLVRALFADGFFNVGDDLLNFARLFFRVP
jgi:hypothetical protein